MNRPLPAPARDVALLLARLVLGTIMFAHGYQKLMIDGLGRTTEGFESMSIPAAIISAAFVTVVEVVGSVLVVVGALIPVVAAFYLVVMVGAAVFVHIPHGIFVGNGGWELVGAIGALLLALAAAGSGRYGVDHLVTARQAAAAALLPAAPPIDAAGTPAPDPTIAFPAVPAAPSAPAPAARLERRAPTSAFAEPSGADPLPAGPSDDDTPPLPVRLPRSKFPRPRPWPGPSRTDHRP